MDQRVRELTEGASEVEDGEHLALLGLITKTREAIRGRKIANSIRRKDGA
jgi:hypothetical protein